MTLLRLRLSQHWGIYLLWCAVIVTGMGGCDDTSPSEPQNEMVADSGEELDKGSPLDLDTDADMSSDPTDQGGDLVDLSMDADVPDMEWTFDLAVVDEEYRNRAPEVSRVYAGYAERQLGFHRD